MDVHRYDREKIPNDAIPSVRRCVCGGMLITFFPMEYKKSVSVTFSKSFVQNERTLTTFFITKEI